jgi:predicted short-subunit dehydrogenase-like oxidoreductase (DUF2520 family)
VSEQILIIGAGRMGLALGMALHRADATERLVYYGRSYEPPPHPIFDPPFGAEYRLLPVNAPPPNSILLLAVPDDALAEVAWDVARIAPASPGCVALHLSGALSSDPLDPLHTAGWATGSMHPLQSVAEPMSGAELLAGAAFALSGEPAAIRAARRLVNALHGLALVIPVALRPLYHAAAVMASNYLVTLADTARGMMEEAGVSPDDSLPALLPLMRGTLHNLDRMGLPAALTGPIARGDAETVRLHVSRLSRRARALYCALGLETLRLARDAGLDERRAEAIESLLSNG